MEAEASDEWEEVVALDGKTYRVLKNTPPPNPSLVLTDSEESSIDEAIARMAKLAPRRGINTNSPRKLNEDTDLYKKIDEIIVEALVAIRPKVPDDSAEKLFDRLMRVCDDWPNEKERWAIGLVFIRFLDTMNYLVSYRGKYRGVLRKNVKFSKDEALCGLKARGLTRR